MSLFCFIQSRREPLATLSSTVATDTLAEDPPPTPRHTTTPSLHRLPRLIPERGSTLSLQRAHGDIQTTAPSVKRYPPSCLQHPPLLERNHRPSAPPRPIILRSRLGQRHWSQSPVSPVPTYPPTRHRIRHNFTTLLIQLPRHLGSATGSSLIELKI